MKTTTKIIALCLVAITFVLALVSCGLSAEDVAGTYYGTYTYTGNKYAVTIVLGADMTYSELTVKNDLSRGTRTGKYEIVGDEVKLIDSSDSSKKTPYTYSDGALTNGGHVFSRTN